MSVFTYNDGVPGANNDPSEDQPDMLVNTQSIKGIWGPEHYTFGTGIDFDGRHTSVSLPNHAAPGLPSYFGVGGVLYCNSNFPVWQNSANANNNIATYVGTPVTTNTGLTYLPGGIIMQWGTTAVSSGANTLLFAGVGAINFPNNCFNVQITSIRNSSNVDTVYLISSSTNGFDYRNTSSGGILSISWVAIGN